MTTQTETNTFTIETMTQVDANTVNFYGVSSLTENYMRVSFTARTRDDHAFLTHVASMLANKQFPVSLTPEYHERSDTFWCDYFGWSFPIERFFDWR